MGAAGESEEKEEVDGEVSDVEMICRLQICLYTCAGSGQMMVIGSNHVTPPPSVAHLPIQASLVSEQFPSSRDDSRRCRLLSGLLGF